MASILANDIDIDSTVLNVVPVGGSEIGGTVTIDTAGNLVFTPDASAGGIGSFQYVVVADGVTSKPGTVSIALAGGNIGEKEIPTEEDLDSEPETIDPAIDPSGVAPETLQDNPVVPVSDTGTDFSENLADTISNDASSLENQDVGVEFSSESVATTYAYADNQQLADLVFQLATTRINENLVLSTFDPTFIANVFWDELDDANRDYLVNKLQIGIPKIVASTASFLTVGYLAWIIRGGVLMTTVMTSLPAWRSLDIVPIIESANLAEEDDESIEQMVDN